jgi:hypothetical protein
MPRNNTTLGANKSNNTFPKYIDAHHIMPRMSYTGPIMPRQEPITVKPPSFGQSVKEGFSFGFGASIARNVVDSWFGTPKPVVSTPVTTPSNTSLGEQLAYQQCLKDGGDHEKCKDYII